MQEIERRLAEKKIAPTAMRLLILNHLVEQNSALSLSDIERALAPADRVTIYRSLKTFEDNGLIHTIEDGTGIPKYALCLENCNAEGHHDLHLHFNCIKCRETYCLSKINIPKITLPDKFQSHEVSLIIKGICDKCSI